MSFVTHDDLQRQIQDGFRQISSAQWVREMLDHYQQTGAYRPQDLRRLLGDPNKGVDVGPEASRAAFFSQSPRD